MLVAQARGVTFRVDDTVYSPIAVYSPAAEHKITANLVLVDVAKTLGYEIVKDYNEACLDRPDEVRARLAAL